MQRPLPDVNGEIRDEQGRLLYAPRSNYGHATEQAMAHIPNVPNAHLRRGVREDSGGPLELHEVRTADKRRAKAAVAAQRAKVPEIVTHQAPTRDRQDFGKRG